MQKIFLLLSTVLALSWAGGAAAAPCASTPLSAYVGLGAAGCTIGGFTFSNFMPLSPPTGAVDFTTVVLVPVVDSPTSIGLDFQVRGTATPGTLIDQLVRYRITGGAGSVSGATLSFTGATTTGDASVTVVENLCVGGTFTGVDGVSGCTGVPKDLIVIDAFGSADPPISTTFVPNVALTVVTDIGVDGGTDGSGSLVSASNRFTTSAVVAAVPEPETTMLWVAAIAACLVARRAASRLRSA